MEREWTGNVRRLSEADRVEIERRIQDGETFATIAAAVRCSTKSIQRYLALTGGIKQRRRQRSALRLSLREREEIFAGPERWRVSAIDREAPGASAIHDLARGIVERVTSSVSVTRGCAVRLSVVCGRCGRRNRSRRGWFATILTT